MTVPSRGESPSLDSRGGVSSSSTSLFSNTDSIRGQRSLVSMGRPAA